MFGLGASDVGVEAAGVVDDDELVDAV